MLQTRSAPDVVWDKAAYGHELQYNEKDEWFDTYWFADGITPGFTIVRIPTDKPGNPVVAD